MSVYYNTPVQAQAGYLNPFDLFYLIALMMWMSMFFIFIFVMLGLAYFAFRNMPVQPSGLSCPKNNTGSDSLKMIPDTLFAILAALSNKDGKDGKDGENGKDGETGPAGPAGQQGQQGKKGENGKDGKNGETGPVGPIGPAGQQGENGKDGETGPAGQKGENGKDGKDGKDGLTSSAITQAISAQPDSVLTPDVPQYKPVTVDNSIEEPNVPASVSANGTMTSSQNMPVENPDGCLPPSGGGGAHPLSVKE